MANRKILRADKIISINGKLYIDKRKPVIHPLLQARNVITEKKLPIFIAKGLLIPLDSSQTGAITTPQTTSQQTQPQQSMPVSTAQTVSIPASQYVDNSIIGTPAIPSVPVVTGGGGGITIPSSGSDDYMSLFQAASGQQNLTPPSSGADVVADSGNRNILFYGLAGLAALYFFKKGKRK